MLCDFTIVVTAAAAVSIEAGSLSLGLIGCPVVAMSPSRPSMLVDTSVAEGLRTQPLRRLASAAPVAAGVISTISTMPPGDRGLTQ